MKQMRNKPGPVFLVLGIALFSANGGTTEAGSGIDTSTQAITTNTQFLWANPSIPVCWENPGPGNRAARTWIEAAIENSWDHESAIDFTGWGTCANGDPGIHIRLHDAAAIVGHVVGRTHGVGSQLNARTNGMEIALGPVNDRFPREEVEWLAMHEFGHGLGFSHEHNRIDRAETCVDIPQARDGAWHVTPYDEFSVMNYCGLWERPRRLSDHDIQAVRRIYGHPPGQTHSDRYHIEIGLSSENYGTQADVCLITPAPFNRNGYEFDFRRHRCAENEARSLILSDVPAGYVITLYDQPDGALDDGWVEVMVKRDINYKVIGTFERSFEDEDVRVRFHRDWELDGRISRLEIAYDFLGAGPVIDLLEDNNGKGGIVCSLKPFTEPNGPKLPYTISLQHGSSVCENNDAESAVLFDMPKGAIINLYTDPSCNKSWREDSFATLYIQDDIDIYSVPTFERWFDDDKVRQEYWFIHEDLDDDISCIEVDFRDAYLEVNSNLFLYGPSESEASRGTVRRVFFNSLGQVASDSPLSTRWRRTWEIYPGDLNGDGTTDLFLYDPSGSENRHGVAYRVLMNSAYQVLIDQEPHIASELALSTQWRNTWEIYPGDYNGDGITDLFLYDPSGDRGVANRVLFNRAGKIAPGGELQLSSRWRTTWEIYPGDYNGDGITDLFLYDPSGDRGVAYRVFFNRKGEIEPGAELQLSSRWRNTWEIYPGDYNGDGITDLFLYDPTGTENKRGVAYRVLFNRDGEIEPGAELQLSTRWRNTWEIYPGDYNGDGITDLFLYDPTGTENKRGVAYRVLFNRKGEFGPGAELELSTRWRTTWDVYPGDHNGDGITDLFLNYPGGTGKEPGIAYQVLFNRTGRIGSEFELSTEWGTSLGVYPGGHP